MIDAIQLFTNYGDIDRPRFIAVRNGSVIRGTIVTARDADQAGFVAQIDGVSWQAVSVHATPVAAVEFAADAVMGPDPRAKAAKLLLDAATTEGDIPYGDGAAGDRPFRLPHADSDGHCQVAAVDRRHTGDVVFRSRNVVCVVDTRQFDADVLEWWRKSAPLWNTVSHAQMAIVERFDATSETHMAYSSWFRSTDSAYAVATFAVAPTVRGQRVAVYAPTLNRAGERIALEGFDPPAAIVGATTWHGANGDDGED